MCSGRVDYHKGVELNFIRPEKPIENALAESFFRKLRDECYDTDSFMSIKHAGDIIEDQGLQPSQTAQLVQRKVA